MSFLKPALIGIAISLLAYGVSVGLHGKSNQNTGGNALDAVEMTPLTPSAKTGAKNLAPTLAPAGTTLAPSAKNLAPTLAPAGTTLAPSVTPRISSLSTPTPSNTPSPTPSVTVTPRIATPTPSPAPVQTPSPTPTQTPTPSPSPEASESTAPTTPTSTPTPTSSPRVVINEVAWAGTKANPADEWIELYNAGDAEVDLSGWSLCEGDTLIVQLSGNIESSAYYLIERGADDGAITDISADLAHAFGGSGLSNSGEHLFLRIGSCTEGSIADEIGPGSWYAGSASPGYASMERVGATLPGTDPTNWGTNNGTTTTGLDADGNPISGTPRYQNSVFVGL